MIPTRLNFKTCLGNPCKKANQTPLALRIVKRYMSQENYCFHLSSSQSLAIAN